MACDLADRGILNNSEYRDRRCSSSKIKDTSERKEKKKGRKGKWERRKEKKPEKSEIYSHSVIQPLSPASGKGSAGEWT